MNITIGKDASVNNMKQILGVKIDEFNIKQALDKAVDFLNSSSRHKIFTPNPEMLVKAQKDNYFKEVLNSADLNICDGFGLSVFAGVDRIPGADFMIDLCRLASEKGISIYLIGSGNDDVVKQAAQNLKEKFPHLIVAGYDRGPEIHESEENGRHLRIEEINNETAIDRINQSGAKIIFVGFGMGKQEKWIHEYIFKLSTVKIAMGVGGAIDYISGVVPRAPLFLRKLGLEWLYRLAHQPSRIKRIWNATAVFTYFALKDKYGHKN